MTSDLTELTHNINERRPDIKRFESYYDGTAKVIFVGEALQNEFGEQLEHMFVNRCAPIIETTLDRLEVQGFESTDRSSDDQQANTEWKRLRLSKVARTAHFDALTSGDGWVLVWPDGDDVIVAAQEPTDISVIWNADDPDVIDVAAKVWQLRDGTWRLNLYYADRLEKYITNGPHERLPDADSAWSQHSDDGDGAWPVRHNMGRVPLFHIALSHRAGTYGRSDLADIIPLQDRLNLTIANQAVAEEFQSFRQRWATGIQPQLDPETGEYIHPFSSGADRLWIAGDNANFGDFDAADLTQFEAVIEGHEKRLARTARVPMHYLIQSGTPPSGESLKTAEAPFIAKVKARQSAFGDTWSELMEFILSLRNHGHHGFTTMWVSAETRDETAELERGLIKQNLGVSQQQVLRELDYSDDDIEKFEQERMTAGDAYGDALQRSFNAA